MVSCNWKVHTGIPIENVTLVCDEFGHRAEFKRLLGEMKRGDVLGITTVAALEDTGKPKSLMQNLKKLEQKGIVVSVAYGPRYHFSQYETMVRLQAELEDQREFYRTTCIPSIGHTEKT